MQYRQLGASDLQVSEIALGSLIFAGEVEAELARACVKRALDLGINFFDTANMYGRGAAESFLGEALAGLPRRSYVLATKVYFPMSDTDQGLSRAQILKQLDASLHRLRTDYIDLYQCHRYDDDTPLEETMAALSEVVRNGKVRWIGFSEWPIDKIRSAATMAGVERFVSSQPQYSMIWRQPEREVIPFCANSGIGQLAYSPLVQGVLTGKYLPGAALPAGSRATHSYMGDWIRGYLTTPVLEAVQMLRALAERNGLTSTQLALAWILRQPSVAAAIIGASRPEHVQVNAAASGLTVAPEVMAEADRITSRVALS